MIRIYRNDSDRRLGHGSLGPNVHVVWAGPVFAVLSGSAVHRTRPHVRYARQRMRDVVSRIAGFDAWQHGWSVGKQGTFSVSVTRRSRHARFGYELYRGENGYRYLAIWFGSPTKHVWWSRNITVYYR